MEEIVRKRNWICHISIAFIFSAITNTPQTLSAIKLIMIAGLKILAYSPAILHCVPNTKEKSPGKMMKSKLNITIENNVVTLIVFL